MNSVPLIAQREIQARVTSKSFGIMTGLMVLAVLAVIIIFKAVGGSSTTVHVGVTPATAPLSAQLVSIGHAADVKVEVTTVSATAGTSEVRTGKLDALITGVAGGTIDATVKNDLNDSLHGILTAIAQQQVLRTQITRLGGQPDAVAAEVEGAGVHVTTLSAVDTHRGQRIGMSTVIGVLTYVMLIISIQLTGQGVVEEKSNRIVEILLAAVKPWQLLAGKVIGIGVVTIAQVVLVAVVGAVAATVTGVLHLPSSLIGGSAAQAVLWFLLGYALYAVLMAAAASLISRQEELGGIGTPFTLTIVAGYVLGVSMLPSAPHGTAVTALSMVPLFSPVLMPMRAPYGIPVWQELLAVILMLAAIVIAVAVASRIYRNAVVHSGGRVSWRSALKGLG